jgi:hypothetical protein
VVLIAMAALVVALRSDPTERFLSLRDRITTSRRARTWTSGSSRVEELELLDAAGARVSSALVRLPPSPAGIRRSLVIYSGKDTGEQILDLIPERPDLALVAPQYPPIDPEGWVEKAAWPARLRGAVYSTVAGGMAALAYLDREGIPRGRTVALAASLGTSFGTIHAALDDRVDELVIVHGGGNFRIILRHIYANRGKPLQAALAPWAAEVLIDAFDPVHWIGRVGPRPVLLIATRRDRHFPVASVEALYAAAHSPKRLVWTETDHVGASKTEIVEAIVAQIEAYLDETAGGFPRP